MPEVIARFTILKQTIAVPAKSSTGDGEGWAGPASITIPLLAANGDVKPDTDNWTNSLDNSALNEPSRRF